MKPVTKKLICISVSYSEVDLLGNVISETDKTWDFDEEPYHIDDKIRDCVDVLSEFIQSGEKESTR